MADYELGTAHGRIVVDYDDRGINQAEKSLDSLQTKAKRLLGQFTAVAKSWVSQARDMGRAADDFTNKAENVAKTVATISVAAAAINGPVRNLVPGIKVLKDLKEAFGGLPNGAERYPKLVQNIIRVSAAVGLLHGATGLLARATRNVTGLNVLTRGLAGLGSVINTAATPLRVVASAATGFLTVLKGFETIKKYAKYFELFHVATNGLATGLQIALPLVAKLAQDIKNLLGAVALAPAALGAAVFGFAALKIATGGFADALKSVGDPAKFAKALKKLSPEAQKAAIAVRDLSTKWKEMKKDLQDRLFAGIAGDIKDLGNTYIPILWERFGRVTDAVNVAGREVAAFLKTTERVNQVKSTLTNFANIWENLTPAIKPLVQVLLDLGEVGSRVLKDLSKNVGPLARQFADFVDKAKRTGQLEAWMRRGVKAVGDLVKSILNLGKIFKTVFDGLGISGGNGFLDWLAKATDQFNAFLKTAEGQQILKDIGQWMADGAAHAKELADVFLKDVLPAIQAFLPFIKAMGDAVNTGLVAAIKVLAPIFKTLGEILSALAPALAPIVTAFVFFGTVLAGLGLALKIASGAWAVLRSALLLFKGVEFVVGLLGRLSGGVGLLARALGPLLKILKGGLIASALIEIGRGIDKVNLAAAGGDPSKLDDMGQSLHDFITIWDETWNAIKTGDFSWFGKQLDDIKSEWDDFVKNFNSGDSAKSPVGAWFQKVKDSFNKDFVGFFVDAEAKLDEFYSTIGTKLSEFGKKVGESFDRDFLGFFRDLPGKIGSFISSIPGVISGAASDLWSGFLATVQANFGPVIAFFSQSPFEIGFAIGAGIGTLVQKGGELINNLLLGAQGKWIEFMAWLSGLLPGIIENISAWGSALYAQAQAAWEQFKTAVGIKVDETVGEVQQVPQKAGDALSTLGSTIAAKASEAWEQFKTWTTTKANEAITFIQGLPAKAGAALASLRGFLEQKAREAMDGFKQWVTNKSNEVIEFIRGIPGRIVSALGNLGSLLVNAGRSVIDGLLAGIKAGVQAMYDFVSGIAAGIAARKGPIPKDRILLIPAGVAIVQGLVKGMKQTMPELYKQVNAVNSTLGGVGGLAGSVNLSPTGAMTNVSSMAQAPTIPTTIARGGDGASAGDNYNIGTVTIPAKDIKEFKDVTDFFGAVKQTARAGRSTR